MKKVIVYLSMFAIAMLVFSCKKDSTPSKTDILTGSTWKITSKTISPSITVPLDSLGHVIIISNVSVYDPDSVKNFGYKFNSNGSFTCTDSANKVLPPYPNTWQFNSDDTQITLGQQLEFDYSIPAATGVQVVKIIIQKITISSITSTQITATYPLVFNNANYTVTIVFQPK